MVNLKIRTIIIRCKFFKIFDLKKYNKDIDSRNDIKCDVAFFMVLFCSIKLYENDVILVSHALR